ncbi:uncharacterized protein LOC103499655 isoform X2 [Cucumis melo]|uniref:Uncharacterized protein LOC103499655 isoform X2 n=1 Tax=Cucumis melo TaxID=3656 RepID=A0ABM3LBZ4_CUCME|nr:uncharacterized protein LOC103499655 isoform X2 [Cucumis melo]
MSPLSIPRLLPAKSGRANGNLVIQENQEEDRQSTIQHNDGGGHGKEPPKSYVRYVTRQRRSDAKKALKNLLYNSGSTFPKKESKWSLGGHWPSDESDQSSNCNKKGRAKSSTQKFGKSQHKRPKRKFGRESFFANDFNNDYETTFHATFGDRSYSWSFGWTNPPNWKNQRAKEWDNLSDCESDDEKTPDVGSCSDRAILGLPRTGPLKMEEVKTAFRLSALKWHPDKHPGPSQAMAEEKFKLCVNAYNSLCSALSPGKTSAMF